MGWATPGFEGREMGICGCARVDHLGEKKTETELLGLNFCERIAGGGVFGQWEHRWGGLHQGLRAGRGGSAGA
jgi:hypothetical protein